MSEPALAINLATTEMAAPDELQLLPQISATADVSAQDLWTDDVKADSDGNTISTLEPHKWSRLHKVNKFTVSLMPLHPSYSSLVPR